LLIDHGLAVRAFERDAHVIVLGGLFSPGFDGLPELVLKAFRDEWDIGLLGGRRDCEADERANTDGANQSASTPHRFLLVVGGSSILLNEAVELLDRVACSFRS
jgi:hypothetical protein